jgi:two-component system OmpR family response regulator
MPSSGSPELASPRVLLIEDDAHVAEALTRFLERSGMRTAWAGTGARGMELKRSFAPEVVLVDLELPDMNGVDLIGWLNGQQDCGIIVVSGRGEAAEERILGLELGADDYMAKPPQLRELVARVRAVHRRSRLRNTGRPGAGESPLQVGPWRIDLRHRTVSRQDGPALPVTAAEFAAMQELLLADGEPVSRDRLSEVALRRPWRAEDRSIDQLISSVRRKLGDGEDGTRLIQSVRGAGYVLAAQAQPVSE